MRCTIYCSFLNISSADKGLYALHAKSVGLAKTPLHVKPSLTCPGDRRHESFVTSRSTFLTAKHRNIVEAVVDRV